jgi:hypothetical protein
MGKTLCDLTKLLEDDFDQYAKLVKKPRYLCKSCGRAARRKKHLCEPKELSVKKS